MCLFKGKVAILSMRYLLYEDVMNMTIIIVRQGTAELCERTRGNSKKQEVTFIRAH